MKINKIKTTLTNSHILAKLKELTGIEFDGYQKMLVWGLLPGVITSCYQKGCLNCFHANSCRVSQFTEVSETEFIEIMEEEYGKTC